MKRLRLRTFLLAGLAFLIISGGWYAWRQLAHPTAKPRPGVPEYGPFFAHLRKLGLPDSRGYRYAGECRWGWCGTHGVTELEKLGLQGDHFFRCEQGMDEYSLLHLDRQGATQTHGRLFAAWPDRFARLQVWIQRPTRIGDRLYHTADLARDLRKLLVTLDDPSSRIWDNHGVEVNKSIMVLAAHAHRIGEESLANAVLHRYLNGPDLSRLPPTRNQVEEEKRDLEWMLRRSSAECMKYMSGHLVLHRVLELGNRLAKDWNWVAYRNDLAKIRVVLSDMGHQENEEWLGLELLDQRLRGEVMKMGLETTLEDLNREISLAGPEAFPSRLLQGEYWLFRDWPALAPGDKPSPLEKLLRMGPAAIPLLLAWIEIDPEWRLALTEANPGFTEDFSVPRPILSLEYPDWEDSPVYNTPVTRRELSRYLLRPLEATLIANPSQRQSDGSMQVREISAHALDRMREWSPLSRDERIRYFRAWDGLLLKVLAWDARLAGEGPATNPWREAFGSPPPGVLGEPSAPDP